MRRGSDFWRTTSIRLTGKKEASERTLCGHLEFSKRGMGDWQPPYAPAGTVQNKVADASMAEHMSFTALAGHACGTTFHAAEHLRNHPEFIDQKDLLHDIDSGPGQLLLWLSDAALQPSKLH